MSRILFAWELGGGLGHLAPFRPIADRLIARGHEITLAARDVERAHLAFGGSPVRIVQAPICAKTYGGLAEPPLNYAEILMRYGYLDAPLLRGMLRAWRDLLVLADADIVIADHAPGALLAARGGAAAPVALGSPFAVPPPLSPTPAMRSWMTVPAERLAGSDASVLKVINESLPSGAPPLGALHQIFEGAARLYSGVPGLDPYGPRDPGDYLGLYSGAVSTSPPRWPEGEGPRIFAYLHGGYQNLEAALDALAASPARVLAYLLGTPPALARKYEGPRFAISPGPVDLDAALADADLCVLHANFGTMMGVLRAGKPMTLLPVQLEHYLLASRVEKLGMARVMLPEAQTSDIAAALAEGLAEPAFARAAREFALRHREPSVDTIAERAAARIEALAQGRPG